MAGFKRRLWATIIALLIFVLMASGLKAQISPGELHKSHAFLEGVDNCTRCHSPQGDELPDKCLECHRSIADQRNRGEGLHTRAEYQECVLCHVEHHGRDFDLIHFKGGVESFDHTQTGFNLDGKHAKVKCRNCHQPENIRDSATLNADNVSLSRTWLGLKPECAACHTDQHRGQFTTGCDNCHVTTGWRPAVGFVHDRARFALQGSHRLLSCDKCHRFQASSDLPGDSGFVVYRPLAFEQCGACHKDPHTGRLGTLCSDCHNVDGWKQVRGGAFDHDRTRFPLEGLHARVACEKCHDARRPSSPLKFAACLDCHSDYHRGAFARRARRGACEECHAVNGFRPSLFTISLHAQTAFPLGGAHLAIPCERCHQTAHGDQKFVFSSIGCLDCHRDPHKGQVDKLVAVSGCQTCHTDRSWSEVHFDHSTTTFPLAGKHTTVACRKCHLREGPPSVTEVCFSPLSDRCESCHKDVHRGQFAAADLGSDCAKCHTPPAWNALHFDHTRDASFALDGAHRGVVCDNCHPTVGDEAGRFVRYKGISTKCSACHSGMADGRETGS